MKHIRVLSLCFVGAFVLAAVVSASASAAEPAMYECAKSEKVGKGKEAHYTGKYEDKACSEVNPKGEGEYELVEGVGKQNKFKGKGAAANWEIQGVGGFTCNKQVDSGVFTSPTFATKVMITLKECSGHFGPEPEVTLGPLKGELGYISKANDQVGIDLSPESGPYLGEWVEGPDDRFRVSGSAIGIVTSPLNAVTKSLDLTFEQSGGIQRPNHLEGSPVDTLNMEFSGSEGQSWGEPFGIGYSGELLSTGEPLELKA